MKKLVEIFHKNESTIIIVVIVVCALSILLEIACDHLGADKVSVFFLLIAVVVYRIREKKWLLDEQERQIDDSYKNCVVGILHIALTGLESSLSLPDNDSKGFSSVEKILSNNGVRMYRVRYLRMPDSRNIPQPSWCQFRDILSQAVTNNAYIRSLLQPNGLHISDLAVSSKELVVTTIPLVDIPSHTLAQTIDASIRRNRAVGGEVTEESSEPHQKLFDDEL